MLQKFAGVSAQRVGVAVPVCCSGRVRRKRLLLQVKASSSEIGSCLSQTMTTTGKNKEKYYIYKYRSFSKPSYSIFISLPCPFL